MKVVALAGYSGAGKTSLAERIIPLLTARGLRVSVAKHAHHGFDIDRPGKDTWRHRQAGAYEVVVASNQRMALQREFEQPTEWTVHDLLNVLSAEVDWVIVEGFKQSTLLKIEVWRAANGKPVQYPDNSTIVAIATDDAMALPVQTERPVLDLNRPEAVSDWLVENGARFEYVAHRSA